MLDVRGEKRGGRKERGEKRDMERREEMGETYEM